MPTKSPSSGLHKPTWKPSSKPAENAMEATLMTASNPAVATAPMTSSASSSSSAAYVLPVSTSLGTRESGPKGAAKKLAHDGAPEASESALGTARALGVANQASSSSPLAQHTAEAAGEPSKSPSSGLHKPTWKPSSKPAENAMEASAEEVPETDSASEGSASVAKAGQASNSREAGPKGAKKTLAHDGAPTARRLASSPTKSPSSGLHKPTWKPSSKPAEHRRLATSSKPAEHSSKSSKPNEHSSNSEVGAALPRRNLAGSPTKSPSSGLHKPTWKPSSKPAERRELAGEFNAAASASKNGGASPGHAVVKMRSSANVPPSKSPSAGLHKPTWKPSSKPAENAMEASGVAAVEEATSEDVAAAR